MAEVERRLSMDSTDSGRRPSKKERDRGERGAAGSESPSASAGRTASGEASRVIRGKAFTIRTRVRRRTRSRRRSAAGAGRPWMVRRLRARAAQVADVQVVRTVTEWAPAGRRCAGCGTVTFAEPPPGAHAGSVSYGPVLNAAAVVLTAYGNVPPERAAGHGDAAGGAGLAGLGGQGQCPAGGAAGGRPGPGHEAMLAALAGEKALAADETPVNVWTTSPRSPPGGKKRTEQDPEEEKTAPGAPHVRRPARWAADLAAGHRPRGARPPSPWGSRPRSPGC